VLETVVTELPEAPVSLTAAAPAGAEPTGVANIWSEGPAVGAGVHWNAQPTLQPAAMVVKAGLIQLPWDCVRAISTRAVAVTGGPDAVVVEVVDDPAAVVVVDDPAPVVVVDVAPEFFPPPGATIVVVELDEVEPAGGGGV
jgi:hypothetical protein